MNISYFILADVVPLTSEELLARRGIPDWGTFTVIGASCLVGLVTMLGVAFYYTRRRRQRPHHKHHHRQHREESRGTSAENASPASELQSSDGKGTRRRRRHRRRDHRPRNPTLAETGGLPPVRTEPPPGV